MRKRLPLILLIPFLFSSSASALEGNLNLSATVPASPTDLQSSLSLLQPASAVFPQDTTLTYEITYGSKLPYTVDTLTVEATWDLGTLAGSSNPSVDVLTYVVNSATDGYNGVSATIDTTNRKITWKILNFPANTTDRKVSFKLKTNSNYTGSSFVTFPISAKVSGIGTSTKSELSDTYRYKKTTVDSPTATPTDAPNPTETPAPTTQATPTPTNQSRQRLQIATVDIPEIAEDTAGISITTSKRSRIEVSYGTSPNTLEKSVSDSNFARTHRINLNDLKPETTYYFTIMAVTRNGDVVHSDTFTLTTATASDAPTIGTESIILTSDNLLLTDAATTKTGENGEKKSAPVVIPVQTGFDFEFKIPRFTDIKRVQAFVRNKFVLGFSTLIPDAEANTQTTELTETSPGVFRGKLLTNATTGNYEIFIRIEDKKGNVTEQKVGEVRVVPRLTILDKATREPLENARLLYSLYSDRRKRYEIISATALSIKNPTFTNADGQATTVLPLGRYKVKVSAIGYKTSEVAFTIGSGKGEEFPTVLLQKEPFNIFHTIKYYYTILFDIFTTTKEYVKTLSASIRFFNFLSLITIFSLVYLTLLSFSIRTAVPVRQLLHHFLYHFLEKKHPEEKKTILSGQVVSNDTDKPLSDVTVFLLDGKTQLVINQGKTDKDGEFRIQRDPNLSYSLRVFKFGYHLFTKQIGEDESTVRIGLSSHEVVRFSALHLSWYFRALLGFLFEALLLASFAFELTVGYVLGWKAVFVYILCSIINLILWVHYLKHQQMHKI